MSVSVATLGVAVSVLFWSWVADRRGRLVAMRRAIGAAAGLGLVVPLSPDLDVMLGLRLAEGMALGGLPALAVTYLHDEGDPRHAAAASAVYISGTTVGGALGRLVSGLLADPLGWRWALAAVAVLCAGAAAVFMRVMPPPEGYEPVAATAATVVRGVRANLADPRMLVLYAQPFLLMGGFVAVYNYLGFRLESPAFGLSAAASSLLFLAYGAGTVSSRRSGRWVERWGRAPVLGVSTVVMLVGLVGTLASSLWGVLVALLVFTAGFFAAHATASGWVGARATTGRAQATSLYNMAYYVGSALLGWSVGYAWSGAGWGGVVLTVGGLILAALGLLVRDSARDRVRWNRSARGIGL